MHNTSRPDGRIPRHGTSKSDGAYTYINEAHIQELDQDKTDEKNRDINDEARYETCISETKSPNEYEKLRGKSKRHNSDYLDVI